MEAGDVDDSLYRSRRTMGRRTIDTSQWPSPDEGALEGNRRALYFARKQAVSLYVSGATADTIKRLTSLGAKQAYRLIRERCLEIHPDGRPYGWRGLVPWVRLKHYRRLRKVHVDQFGGGAAGALQALLDAHRSFARHSKHAFWRVPQARGWSKPGSQKGAIARGFPTSSAALDMNSVTSGRLIRQA